MEENKNIDIENENIEDSTGVEEQEETKQDEKTYSKEELSALTKKEIAKVKAKMPSKEELEAFKQWQDSQKSEQEKLQAKEQELNEKSLEIENKLKKANIMAKLTENKIPDKAYKLFMNEIDSADEVEDKFDEILKEHDYLLPSEEDSKQVTTGYEKKIKEEKSTLDEMLEAASKKGYIKK